MDLCVSSMFSPYKNFVLEHISFGKPQYWNVKRINVNNNKIECVVIKYQKNFIFTFALDDLIVNKNSKILIFRNNDEQELHLQRDFCDQILNFIN